MAPLTKIEKSKKLKQNHPEETDKPKKKCRTCLAQHNWMTSLYDKEYGSKVAYSTMISKVTGVKIYKGDGLPYNICIDCKRSVTVAYQYRVQARKIDKELQQYLLSPTDGVDPIAQEFADQTDMLNNGAGRNPKGHRIKNKNNEVFFRKVSEEMIKIEIPPIKTEINQTNSDDDFLAASPMLNSCDDEEEIKYPTYETALHHCNICGEDFKTEESLQNHLGTCLKVEVESKQNHCPVCAASFESALGLLRHARSAHRRLAAAARAPRPGASVHLPRELYVQRSLRQRKLISEGAGAAFVQDVLEAPICGVCGGAFDSEERLHEHYKAHGSAVILSCAFCDMKFLEAIYLEQHYMTHHADANFDTLDNGAASSNFIRDLFETEAKDGLKDLNIMVCPLCGALLLSTRVLAAHNHTEHPCYTHRCDFCAKLFAEAEMVKVHQKYCISRMPQAQCHVCKQWLLRQYLAKHLLKHNAAEPGIACNICSKVCKTHTILAAHKERMHRPKSAYECDICHRSITDKHNIRKHLEIHDPNRRPVANSFLCLYCGYSATSSSNLLVHTRRRHTHEKPHKCKQCDMAFVRSSCLKQHMLRHTGERRFKCDVCGMAFPKKCTMIRHMRIHTGERPYSCPHCGQAFTQSQDMQAHARRHTAGSGHTCHCGESFVKVKELRQHRAACREALLPPATDPHLAMIKEQLQSARALTGQSLALQL